MRCNIIIYTDFEGLGGGQGREMSVGGRKRRLHVDVGVSTAVGEVGNLHG
jgi:hypothetical protein